MTCIAAAKDKDGTIVMGADNVGNDGGRVQMLASPKVRRCGPFLVGVCGQMRVVQLAHYVFKPPRPKGDLFAFMVTKFAASLRACMKGHGGEIKGDDGCEIMNGSLLVACGGRLFQIDSYYSVIELAEPYHAVGCASQEARSAMHARRRSNARSMVKAGLEAAAAFDINIRPPFTIEAMKKT